ncbi:hypothetical protein BDW66DRAFT_157869 [Aspergillus desertorum]
MAIIKVAERTAIDAANRGQLATGYEHLTVLETIKTFKIANLMCFAMAFSAATDGYQIGINASIIANKGFVAQFTTQTSDDGSPALASAILSGWSSIMSCRQIIGMTSLPFLSSRYGRKGWLIGKLLAGIGVGCVQSTVPTYIAEGTDSLRWTLGSLFAQVALQHLSRSGPTDFRAPIYTQWGQLGLMLFIYLLAPETPAWELLRLHRDVDNYDVDHQLQVLVMTAEHERALAVEQRREHWYAIFRGTNGLRTQAGIDDPFRVKAITSSIQIGTVLVLVTIVDFTGRRLLACSGTTLSWLSCIAIGVIGVAPEVKASTYIFVMFACLWIVMNVLVPYMTNANEWTWGLKTGWFYTGVGCPVTSGMRSAAEWDELFERRIKPWRFHKTRTATQRLIEEDTN